MKKSTILLLTTLLFVFPFIFAQDFVEGSQVAMEIAVEEPTTTDIAVVEPTSFMPPPRDVPSFGQNHYYAVYFDEEGEATVAVKLEMQNIQEELLKEVSLEIPGNVRLVNAFQEVQENYKRCSDWDPILIEVAKVELGENKYLDYENMPEMYRKYCRYWYDYYETKYYGVDIEENKLSKSTQFTFKLERPIREHQTGSLILYYKAMGYVKKSLGAYNFNFETLKLNQDINTVRVAINVFPELYLKGVKSEVEYQESRGVPAMMDKAMTAESGIASQDIQNFVSQIQWAPGLVKTAQGLDPLESFHVTGKYAKSKIALYQAGVYTAALIVLVLLVALIITVKKVARKTAKDNKAFVILSTGIGSSLALFALWAVGFIILRMLSRIVEYQMQGMMGLLIVLLLLLLSLVLLIAPPIVVGLKHGYLAGFLTFAVVIFLLLVLAIIAIVFLGMAQSAEPVFRVMY